jgi:tRNA pseudouridine55 synthase
LTDGIVLYPKPAGATSHDVVATVRRRLGGAKVGHAGTLDPFATGLLLVLVGRATRAQRFLLALPKSYRAVARLGWVSDTGDRDGELRRTGRVPAELRIPTGRIRQRPPAYSAIRVAGERAYRRARRGEPVEPEPREVTVHRAKLVWVEGERACFEIECSSGTYVRSLIAELRDAYCEELVRTRVGPFALADADPERVIPLREALAFLPERTLDPDEARRVGHGQRLPGDGAAGPLRLTHGGELVAIAEPSAGELRPVVVFAAR